MKPEKKKIAQDRMQILINNAIANSTKYPKIAQRQAHLAKKISTKFRVPVPYEIKMMFCKKCKSFIVPGKDSRIRVGRTALKSIRITCNFCGHTYRKVIAQGFIRRFTRLSPHGKSLRCSK